MARLVTPAWQLTPQKVAGYGFIVRGFGVPPVVAVTQRGGRATVTLRVGRVPVGFDLVRASAGWKLAQVRLGVLRLPGKVPTGR